MSKEEEIKLIAYYLWEQEGCPDGRDCQHWIAAEAIWQEQQKPAKAAAAPQPKPQPKAKPAAKNTKKR
jgi:hypothetical protein